jgi:hypothetical protein
MRQGCLEASCENNHICKQLIMVSISRMIFASFCYVRLLNYQLHNSHIQSPITATVAFPKPHIAMINTKIVNSHHSLLCMNLIDVINK